MINMKVLNKQSMGLLDCWGKPKQQNINIILNQF